MILLKDPWHATVAELSDTEQLFPISPKDIISETVLLLFVF